MPADLTLPGTIPGLLRRGSPVLSPGITGEVVLSREPRGFIGEEPVAGALVAHPALGVQWLALDDLALDLSDPTGRAHAAWWISAHDDCYDSCHDFDDWLGEGHYEAAVGADEGSDMDPEDIARLRAVALAVAERTEVPDAR